MTSWLHIIAERAVHSGAAVRIVMLRADGSVPREAGAAMIVTAECTEGTIGGGALELDAIATARSMLPAASGEAPAAWLREVRDYPLGPSLGQCCGGYAKVLFELITTSEAAALLEDTETGCESGIVVRPIASGFPLRVLNHRKDGSPDLPLQAVRVIRDTLSGAQPAGPVYLPASKRGPAWFIEPIEREKTPLFLYGAGHVGRALIRVLSELPFAITWIDTAADRFPEDVEGSGLQRIMTADPPAIAKTAPDGAFHLVMTYSHPLDLAVCHEALKAGTFGYLGLIGSKTKRASFLKRLRELGHSSAALDRLTCPIGILGVTGKEPATIAVSTAAQLLQILAARKSSARASPLAGSAS
ncbi:MAG: xanthine dehydrogenase accessory protein XdhC [Rhodomicrobium sp.]